MVSLFTDLDSTIIYSHRHNIGNDRILAETLNNKPQSYVTGRCYNFFSSDHGISVIPVTTRSFEQYSRLSGLLNDLGWNRALICNGAVLVDNGAVDTEWLDESYELASDTLDVIRNIYEDVCGITGSDAVVSMYDMMLYVRADDEKRESILNMMNGYAAKYSVTVLADRRKIYCFPSVLNKGNAVSRYVRRYGAVFTVSAGDSEFDVPMFMNTDLYLYPDGLVCHGKNGICCEGIFSDQICSVLENLIKDGRVNG